jgi:voltage-gated potassium channel
VKWALDRNALVIVGDATKEAVLRQAQIERARGLVAAVAGDAQNIYITLNARALNPNIQIIARASEEEAATSLRRAGADIVISPYAYSGHRIAQALLQPNVLDFLDSVTTFESGNLGSLIIEEVRLSGGSLLVGQTLEQSAIRQKLGVMVLAMKKVDGRMGFNPPPDAQMEAGDFLIAMGERDCLKELEEIARGT